MLDDLIKVLPRKCKHVGNDNEIREIVNLMCPFDEIFKILMTNYT